MRVCEVIGQVTLGRAHPAVQGGRFLLVRPARAADLQAGGGGSGEPLVVYDELGAGTGSMIGVSEGREAAMPFLPERKPIDAYCACILERVGLSRRQQGRQ